MAKEGPIQKAILDYLNLKRYFCWRNNSGAMKTEHGFVRFGAAGSPDIMLLHEGKFWGIEVKSATGRLSLHQEAFRASMVLNGGKYIVARSVDDVIYAGL